MRLLANNPHPLSSQEIAEFQQLCKEELGKEINQQEAAEYSSQLLDLFRAVYKPIPLNPNHQIHVSK